MSVPSDDRGLLLGDGLFETLLWRDGALVNLGDHVARLLAGCEILGLPAPDTATLTAAAVAAVHSGGLEADRAAVRLSWTAGGGGRGLDRPKHSAPRLLARASPAPRRTGAVRLAVSAARRNEGSPASRVKSLSYLDNVLARREAAEAGADEALMLNNRGDIACAAAANLFWFEGAALVTPALDCGVLAGTMRARVMSLAAGLGLQVEEARAPMTRLDRATGLFLTNSLIGVRPVSDLNGVARPGRPEVEALASAVA